MTVEEGGVERVLSLHGRLAGPEVAEFESVAAGLRSPLRIDVENLVGLDPAGVTALRAQRNRGARIDNTSPFTQMLLDARE